MGNRLSVRPADDLEERGDQMGVYLPVTKGGTHGLNFRIDVARVGIHIKRTRCDFV